MIKYLQPIILFMAKIRKKKLKKGNRSKLEKKLDEVNHTMELVRTIIPVIILIVQIFILIKLFKWWKNTWRLFWRTWKSPKGSPNCGVCNYRKLIKWMDKKKIFRKIETGEHHMGDSTYKDREFQVIKITKWNKFRIRRGRNL